MTKLATGEPKLASVASWAVLVASFGLSATTWVALAVLAGFTGTLSTFDVTLHLAWLMPVAVDGYVVVALVLWMSPVPAPVAAFAKKNTYGAAFVGVAAQSAYHLLHTASMTDETWRVVLAAVVGAAPPSVAAGAVHMRALIRRHSNTSVGAVPEPPSPMTHGTTQPSTIDTNSVPATPVTGTITEPSIPDSSLKTGPAREPNLVPVVVKVSGEPVPTPATVAARITKTPPVDPTDPATVPTRPAPTTRKPRPQPAATTAKKLAPSTTDTPVTESDRAQLTLPVVPADLLTKAERVARQYRTEHGTPITAGQLAVRLKVTSDEAAQALAVLDLAPNPPTKPIPTVNGNRPQGGQSR